jgi:hypothetical protein
VSVQFDYASSRVCGHPPWHRTGSQSPTPDGDVGAEAPYRAVRWPYPLPLPGSGTLQTLLQPEPLHPIVVQSHMSGVNQVERLRQSGLQVWAVVLGPENAVGGEIVTRLSSRVSQVALSVWASRGGGPVFVSPPCFWCAGAVLVSILMVMTVASIT